MEIMPTKAQNNRSLRTLAGILLLIASAAPAVGQTLVPTPYQTVLDNSGRIAPLACVWTYSAGTTTAAATYTDSGLVTPNANPIIADAYGRYVAYLTSGTSLKFVFEKAPCTSLVHGTVLKTVDNIKAVPTADTTAQRQLAEGRLTLTSGTPVTTADVSAAATIYYTPSTGNRIGLYDGSASWNVRTFTEVSLSISSCTASKPYDVWLYDNAGTVTAEMLVWTNTTTRATALTRQDGIYVKTGDATRRYVGTFFCNSTGGQTDDTDAKRFVWNYYNRALRRLQRVETTGSWTYTTATIRQANGATANKVEAMIGVAEVAVDLNLHVTVGNSTGGSYNAQVGIAEDLTNTFQSRLNVAQGAAAQAYILDVTHKFIPAAGYHFYSWNEFSAVVGTTTWYGTAAGLGAGLNASGLLGVVGG